MNRYILTAQAKLDLREIKNYIGQNNLTAARRFVEEFREQCQLIVKFPEMGRSYDEIAIGLRGFPIGNYIILYRQIQNVIEVNRVLSGYRDIETIFSED